MAPLASDAKTAPDGPPAAVVGGAASAPLQIRDRIAALVLERVIPDPHRRGDLDLGARDTAAVRAALRDADEEGLRALLATSRRETVRVAAAAALGDLDVLLEIAHEGRRRAAVRSARRAIALLDANAVARTRDAKVRELRSRLEETAPRTGETLPVARPVGVLGTP